MVMVVFHRTGIRCLSHLTQKLMVMCRVTDESDLPSLWADLAANNGKRDREIIELAFREIATGLGTTELSPVVTPGLAKKITALRFAGVNLDDLDEGINPFSVVIVDHTSAHGQHSYNEAVAQAHDYDDMMRGDGAAHLADLKAVKGAKVVIPESFPLARAMLQAYLVILLGVFGETHPLALRYNAFVQTFINRENFFVGRIQREDTKLGPARLLRFVQLHMRAYLHSIWDARDLSEAKATPLPELTQGLNKVTVGDMTWLPALPPQYINQTASPPYEKKREKPTQVSNPSRNPKFEDFRTHINVVKFNEAIAKAGSPPKVNRQGKSLEMCASYHLRGTCTSNCPRRVDHCAHSEAEDADLYEWCKRAFE